MVYEFGDFLFDSDTQQVYREGEEVHIEPKAMKLLEILISRQPNVVRHQELYDAIWPDVVVLEANLGNLVSDLRAALGDHDHKLIRTVRGCGYAFVGDVRNVRAEQDVRQVALQPHGGRRIVLEVKKDVIGQGTDVDVRIEDTEISRLHVRVVVEPDHATIEDLSSEKGTSVNGNRIEGRIPIDDGDEIRIGPIELKVNVVVDKERPKTSPQD